MGYWTRVCSILCKRLATVKNEKVDVNEIVRS